MWTAIIVCLVWWVLGGVIGKACLAACFIAKHAKRHLLAFIAALLTTVLAVSSITAFFGAIVLGVIKLIGWLNA